MNKAKLYIYLSFTILFIINFTDMRTISFLLFLNIGTLSIILFNTLLVLKIKLRLIEKIFYCLLSLFFLLPKQYQVNPNTTKKNISLLSLNTANSSQQKKLKEKVLEFNSDIVTLQETSLIKITEHYPYSFYSKNTVSGLLTLSKHPIINSGVLKFRRTNNSISFCDIKYETDTIRIYNVHLQSLHINKNDNVFNIIHKVNESFKKQHTQIKELISHQETCDHNMITCGDFNRNPYSFVYNYFTSFDNKDSFTQKLSLSDYITYPRFFTRIDYIFSSYMLNAKSFSIKNIDFSDHRALSVIFEF